MPRKESLNVKTAHEVLRGQSLEPREMLELAKMLREEKYFGLARRLLARARMEPSLNDDPTLRLAVYHQSALCTYKDPDLQAASRLDRALEILRQSCEDINATTDQETLGIAGAIYKRKWELDNQKQDLERSLSYYQRGYAEGPAKDQGYTGINAAFVMDLLAHQEEEEAEKAHVVSKVATWRRSEAKEIRLKILAQVEPLLMKPDMNWLEGKWWFYSTIAEAYFGIGKYEDAVQWLERGRTAMAPEGGIPPWEYESTARQLAHLARLMGTSDNAAGTSVSPETARALAELKKFFGDSEVQSAYTGKIGLALSGGGFRAALFHLGVMARLAELDVLRHVEVISCVSGGSIIGAHYYLEVRRLLESTKDGDITREAYISIIQKLRKDFLQGVQRNVRVRVAAEWTTNLKMIFSKGYTRTMRAGELYESEIFEHVADTQSDTKRMNDRQKSDPRWLNGLYIRPLGDNGESDDNFNLQSDNWSRNAKVPNLILNATSLNTGHNWQFTASWMGEPPAGIDNEIDGNDRLRRLYYDSDDTPKPFQRIRLGHAVAASSCVPGVFEPLMLDELYPDRIVRLVDGGVCDNQGTSSLLEQDCNVILVSDGSGQMLSQNQPSNGLLGVPLRSNSILQARVREAQYNELSARKRAGLLRGFMFVHLKDDLDVDPIDWTGCLDPFDASDDSRPAYRRGPLTRYGIAKDIQKLLAGVRTDLDSFSDVEALALMTSGYRMTDHEFRFSKCIDGFPQQKNGDWDFLVVEKGMTGVGGKYTHLKKQLSVSDALVFKIWKLSPPLRIASWLLAAVAIVLSIWAYFHWEGQTVIHLQVSDIGALIATALIIAIGTYLVGKKLMRIARLREALELIAVGSVMASFGWLIARIHLHIFDPMFLKSGSLDTFKKTL